MHRPNVRGQTSILAFGTTTPGRLQADETAFRHRSKAPMTDVQPGRHQLLDEDGQIFDTKIQKLNFGKCFTKRYGDTVALLRQGPVTIAWVQTQTAQLVPASSGPENPMRGFRRILPPQDGLADYDQGALPNSLRLRPKALTRSGCREGRTG